MNVVLRVGSFQTWDANNKICGLQSSQTAVYTVQCSIRFVSKTIWRTRCVVQRLLVQRVSWLPWMAHDAWWPIGYSRRRILVNPRHSVNTRRSSCCTFMSDTAPSSRRDFRRRHSSKVSIMGPSHYVVLQKGLLLAYCNLKRSSLALARLFPTWAVQSILMVLLRFAPSPTGPPPSRRA